MNHTNPPFYQTLWFKLTAAFLLTAILIVVAISMWLRLQTADNFQQYLAEDQSTQLAVLQNDLVQLYVNQGGWDNAEAYLTSTYVPAMQLTLLDADGQTVAVTGGGHGQGMMMGGDESTLPLTAAGEQIGTLLVRTGRMGMMGTAQAQRFLSSIDQAIGIALLITILAALILSTLLANWLTRPVQQMTTAAQALAAGGTPATITAVTQDELGQLAQTFNHMSHELQKADQQRQQLLADTAHELRTPLAIMQSHLEAMLDGVFEMNHENIAAVHEETLMLNRLVDDLRTLSLADAGQLTLNHSEVDLRQIAEQTVVAFQPLAESRHVQLAVTATTQIPIITADGGRIQQVLNNLVANALRHVPSANGRIHIELTAPPQTVEVTVSDNGPGLSAEMQAQVFERFWRADASRNREQGGSGLGLAICRAIITLHHGRIWVNSVEGQGATFGFSLPIS